MNKREHVSIVWIFLAILTITLMMTMIVLLQETDVNINALTEYYPLIFKGFIGTIVVSTITLILSLIFGFVLYLLSISKIKYVIALTDVFTEIIYGTPLIVMIVVFAFVIGPAFNVYDRALLGLIGLTFYMTPYMKNVYKSAIASIPEEQYLAMEVFGFTSFQKYRYIIIPQVIRVLMPPMMNNFSMIIKGSALLHIIAYTELYYAIKVAQSKTFAFVQGYVLMWMLYLIVTIPLSQLTRYVERKWA